MASSSSSSHSLPTSSQSCKYDVFISFSGEDTRKKFVDHLYSALLQKTIHTYKDDKTLLQGESITPSLCTAIEESRIALIVFSKNYANSSRCLEELAFIMKCKDERGLTVMPIFYDVEPSEVKKQEDKFGEAFEIHEKENTGKVKSWRKALVDASNIAGWEPKNFANGHESEYIKEIVDKVICRLFPPNSAVDKNFVGMRVRLENLKSILEIGSDCVRMVGIWGLGGAGKSTLATAVYMEISHLYEGSCILENIQRKSSEYDLRRLQGKILSAVFNRNVEVYSVFEGKQKLKSMLCGRKVLVVLDDVLTREQLEALAGSCDWFGSGSRIIITTRDKHLLNTHKVGNVHPITLLSTYEAIQLFDKHAYNEEKLIKDYKKLSSYVVSYAAGLPLALKVLGSFLYDKEEKGWISALDRLKDIPEDGIVEKLKISYDGLKKVEKELFLDIACFFKGELIRKYDPMEIFEACGFHPEIGIEMLRQKSLIMIDARGRFDIHDLVQEMAHYIVRGEHPNCPEKHSRVWKYEEINNICLGDATLMENDKIEAIPFNYEGSSSHICKLVSNMKRLRWLSVATGDYENEAIPYEYCGTSSHLRKLVSNMKRLRWLGVATDDVENDGGPNFLSNELCYLDWSGYPGSSFPHSFRPMKLVVLKLKGSLQKELWKDNKHLPHLKVLYLDKMKKLISTPDFDLLPHLQKLELFQCEELKEIHSSLGNHTSLENVLVYDCPKLRMFPTIVHMEKLKNLYIHKCEEIREFPHIQANMGSLVNLTLSWNNIEVLPSPMGEHCTNLVSLVLDGCDELKSIEFDMDALKHLQEFTYKLNMKRSQKRLLQLLETGFHQFPRSLRKLKLNGWSLEDGEIPFGIGELSNLEILDLSWNDFTRLDFSILQLTQLRHLILNNCKRLVELPELPSSVVKFTADCCNSLRAVGDFNRNCKWLCGVSLVGGGNIKDGGRLLESMLQGKAIENERMVVGFKSVEMAKGFTPAGLHKGSSCRLQLPENWCNDFCGFLMCAVFANANFWIMLKPVRICMEQVKRDDTDVVWEESDYGDSYGTWVGYVSFASLTHSSWWPPSSNNLSFHIEDHRGACRGIGVRLVERKTASQQSTPETSSTTPSSSSSSSHFSPNYTPHFHIVNDSPQALTMSFSLRDYCVI